jgi:hypothetical protein
MYMNGVQVVVDGHVSEAHGVVRDKCSFGTFPGTPFADADLDEIKFFDRALSRAEVAHDFMNVKSLAYEVV